MRASLATLLLLAALTAPAHAADPTPGVIFEPIGSPLAAPYAPKKDRIDERPLWELYHQKRYAELRAVLAALRVSNPGWRPPQLFLEATRMPAWRTPAGAAPPPTAGARRPHAGRRVAPRLAGRAAARPPARLGAWKPGAEDLALRLDRIAALARRGERVAAERMLRETLRGPLTPRNRVAALRHATGWLGDEASEALVLEELTAAEQPEAIVALRRLLGEVRLARLARALAAKDDVRAQQLAPSLADELLARRDAGLATSLGWAYFRLGALDRARLWLERALAWNPRSADARLALARTLSRQGLVEQAMKLARALPASDPRRREILGALELDRAQRAYADRRYMEALEALNRAEELQPLPLGSQVLRAWSTLNLGRTAPAEKLALALPVEEPRRAEILRAIAARRASAAAERKDHETALKLLAEAEQLGPLSRDLRLLKAWTLYDRRMYAEAAPLFAQAFDEKPDLTAAEGLFLSAGPAGRNDLLLARRDHPLMLRAQVRQSARDQFARGNYASAAAASPELYPGLAGLDEPSLALGVSRRNRSGQPGMGQLQAMRLPLANTRFQFTSAAVGWLEVDRFLLDAGELPANQAIGLVPAVPTAYVPDLSRAPADVHVPRFRLDLTGKDVLRAMIGTTPIGGPLPTAAIWDVAYYGSDPAGGSKFQLYGKSVADSRLSTIGLRDPYRGDVWGRVVETGVAVGREHKVSDRDIVGGEVAVGLLQGAGVADNDHESASLRWRRQLMHPAFEAAFWGVDGYVESYRRNLSAFTRGHGGYWSPQFHARARLGLDLRTRDLAPFVLHTRLGVGPGYAWVDSTPFFPLTPDGRRHEGFDRFAIYYDGELRATTHVTDWLHAGGSVQVFKNVGYDEQIFTLFVRLLSSPRATLVADDLERLW